MFSYISSQACLHKGFLFPLKNRSDLSYYLPPYCMVSSVFVSLFFHNSEIILKLLNLQNSFCRQLSYEQ